MSDTKDHIDIAVIGYSGHAFVAIDILRRMGYKVTAYCDREAKNNNPYELDYLGPENSEKSQRFFAANACFIAIGDNAIREKIFAAMEKARTNIVSAIHPLAIMASNIEIEKGVMVAAGAVINPLVRIGKGAICNTSCSIDHECVIGNFAHIGPGAILCGNVTVGDRSFVGAGSVVKQGIKIGQDVMVGAGAVIVKDIADGMTVVGNPMKELIKNK